jgi:hypothetical protein
VNKVYLLELSVFVLSETHITMCGSVRFTVVPFLGAVDWCPGSSITSLAVQLLWRDSYIVVTSLYGQDSGSKRI